MAGEKQGIFFDRSAHDFTYSDHNEFATNDEKSDRLGTMNASLVFEFVSFSRKQFDNWNVRQNIKRICKSCKRRPEWPFYHAKLGARKEVFAGDILFISSV